MNAGCSGRRFRARTLAGRALLAAASLVLVVAAVEAALRASGRFAPRDATRLLLTGRPSTAEPITRFDDLLIYAPIPGARTFPWYEIDVHGYRTPPFADTKPPGTFRIIVTGDSTSFGITTLEGQHWAAVLRRALAILCEGARSVEVINAGVIGYSTLQNRLQIERDLAPLQPDLLVWLICGANDLTYIEGASDAERSAQQRSPLFRLARLHVSQLLGAGQYGWGGLSPIARGDSPTKQLRVTPDEVAANVHAIDDLLPGRLVLGLFMPQRVFRGSADSEPLAAAVATVAADRGLPLADVRPVVDGLTPFPLYLDSVHPTPLGHAVIARTVLQVSWPRLGLPESRMSWIEAWQAALAGQTAENAAVLSGDGAPPAFQALEELYRDTPALDERLARQDPSLPEAVLAWDPLYGHNCRARSLARLLLQQSSPARRDEIGSFVRPADPLIACFADEAAFLAADAGTRGLARALIAFGAELGLPPIRIDVRRGSATRTQDVDTAVALLADVVALDPSDLEARYELALALRRARQKAAADAEWTRLAAETGPLADFARGVLAYQARRLDEAEVALSRAALERPPLGEARTLLGRIYLSQDRLDEAAREFAIAAGMIGAQDDLPALMAQIEARRSELAAPAEAAGPER